MITVSKGFNATLVKERFINTIVTNQIRHSVEEPIAAVVGSAVVILQREPALSKVNLSFLGGDLEISIVKSRKGFAFTILKNHNMVSNCIECCEVVLEEKIEDTVKNLSSL